MKSKRKRIILACSILAFIGIGLLGFKCSKSGTKAYLIAHQAEMNAYAEECLTNSSGSVKQTYHGWDVSCNKQRGRVEFLTSGFGLGSGTSYKGVYYSASDRPLGAMGTVISFEPHEDGYIWKQPDGDNWQYTERIMDNWFWFEVHF